MLSDALTIVGSVYKMVIDQKVSSRRGLTPIKIDRQIVSQYKMNTLWINCFINMPPNSWTDIVRNM